MKYLLVLVLLTAEGPKPSIIEVDSLAQCWKRAHAVLAKIDIDDIQKAGFLGVGAGC